MLIRSRVASARLVHSSLALHAVSSAHLFVCGRLGGHLTRDALLTMPQHHLARQ